MQKEKYHNATKIFNRLADIKGLDGLREVSDFLGIKYSTLRNQKSRNSVPYKEIVSNLNGDEINYVIKGDSLNSVNEQCKPWQAEQQFEIEREITTLVEEVQEGPWQPETKLSLIRSILQISQEDPGINQSQSQKKK
mgnify:CR=1 FL=1